MAWARIFLFLGATLCRIFFFCGVKNHLKEDRRSYIRIIILSRVYNKPTQRPVLNWLVSLIGRALHRYRRGQGFESRISLTFFFFRLSFRNCKSCVSNCDDVPSNRVGSVCIGDFPLIFPYFPTLVGPRTRITHGLQSLMGCILPHDALQVPKLLVVVAQHCQHGHHNSANIVSTTMLGVFAYVFT